MKIIVLPLCPLLLLLSQPYLDGADYVRFSRLTINNSTPNSGTTSYAIQLGDNTDNVQIADCRFIGSTQNYIITSIRSFSGTSDSLSIQNSVFIGNQHAINVGNANLGSTVTSISDNEFTDQYAGSILINNADIQVLNNTFKTAYSGGYGYAVELANSTQKTVISNNKITSMTYGARAHHRILVQMNMYIYHQPVLHNRR